jgi:hypothetical protein
MDPVFAVLGASAAAFVAWLLHSWRSDARRTRRVLRRTRVTPIGKLVDGKLACIVGRVEVEGDLVTSLMSRRPCVAYETIVQVFGGLDMTVPSRVEVTRKLVPFFVVDDTGRVRVDAAEAALANLPIERSERYEERIIENGELVRIVGAVVLDPMIHPSGEHGFREAGWKATLTGSRKFPLLIDVEPE